MRLVLTCSAPTRKKKTFKLDFATVVDNYNWIIAKNSDKRLKWRVAQCFRSYFVLLRGSLIELSIGRRGQKS